MNLEIKRRFSERWKRYFSGAELPIVFYYTDEPREESPQPSQRSRCVICELARVRQGRPLRLDAETTRCGGGKRYLGFVQELRDEPLAVIFFAPPDVLSGLFTLANYDEPDPQAVTAPFGAGCASIVYHPYHELDSPRPKAVLGMFDVSARPCVPAETLTFAVPWPKFVRMVENMDESFLITGSWDRVRGRMGREGQGG